MKVRISDGKLVPAKLEEYFEIPMLLIEDEEYGTSDVIGWELVEATESEREILEEAGYCFGQPATDSVLGPPVIPGRSGLLPAVERSGEAYRSGRIVGRRQVDEEGRDFARIAIEFGLYRRSAWLEFEIDELNNLEALVLALRAATPEQVL